MADDFPAFASQMDRIISSMHNLKNCSCTRFAIMGWPAPSDSKSAIRRAGERIRGKEETADDLATLNRYRACHGYVINTFQASLRLRTRGIHAPVAQRLKRASTIVDKLRQGRARDLSTMQDIAGIRVIFSDEAALRAFRDSFHKTRAKHILVNGVDRYDYIANPKVSGYRGIHDVYKYQAGTASGAAWNGLQIELQYRTLCQHAWATAVELSDVLTKNRTKFGQGTPENTRFFQICSELLSRKHESRRSCLSDVSLRDLIEEWSHIEQQAHLFNQLKTVGEQHGGQLTGFVLLVVDESGDLKTERRRSYKDALSRLLALEEEHPEWDVVLVAGDQGDSLRTAFRNYFGNATEFVRLMNETLISAKAEIKLPAFGVGGALG